MALLSLTTIAISTSIFFTFYIGLIINRLYFHPLAKFPGPKLAASSLWYEFYYDVGLRGQFIWKIQEMHQRYGWYFLPRGPRLIFSGPIVRINPDELHIDDPEYYDEIYGSTTRKRDKYGPWVALAGTPGASFSTVGHDHHRLRRGALNPFFSKKAVYELEPVIQAKVDTLVERFKQAHQTGEVIRVDAAFMALTMDVICQYAFANDDGMLMKDDFNLAWKEMIIGAFEGGALLRQFPGMITMMNAVPDNMMRFMMPSMRLMLDWKAGVRRRVTQILNRSEETSHKTIFHELRDSSLPENEKTVNRLCDEGQILTGAGSETTAKALTTAIFYLLVNKEKFWKLKRQSLKGSWSKLEHIPYLVTNLVLRRYMIGAYPKQSAVIAEALRLSLGVTTRLPRVTIKEILRYEDWEIPFGVSEFSTVFCSSANFLVDPY
jgi:cytochrome P450